MVMYCGVLVCGQLTHTVYLPFWKDLADKKTTVRNKKNAILVSRGLQAKLDYFFFFTFNPFRAHLSLK